MKRKNRCLLVVCGRFELRVESHHLCNERMAFLLQLLTGAVLACVQPLALAVVDGLRRGGPGRGGGGEQRRGQTKDKVTVNTFSSRGSYTSDKHTGFPIST